MNKHDLERRLSDLEERSVGFEKYRQIANQNVIFCINNLNRIETILTTLVSIVKLHINREDG